MKKILKGLIGSFTRFLYNSNRIVTIICGGLSASSSLSLEGIRVLPIGEEGRIAKLNGFSILFLLLHLRLRIVMGSLDSFVRRVARGRFLRMQRAAIILHEGIVATSLVDGRRGVAVDAALLATKVVLLLKFMMVKQFVRICFRCRSVIVAVGSAISEVVGLWDCVLQEGARKFLAICQIVKRFSWRSEV